MNNILYRNFTNKDNNIDPSLEIIFSEDSSKNITNKTLQDSSNIYYVSNDNSINNIINQIDQLYLTHMNQEMIQKKGFI